MVCFGQDVDLPGLQVGICDCGVCVDLFFKLGISLDIIEQSDCKRNSEYFLVLGTTSKYGYGLQRGWPCGKPFSRNGSSFNVRGSKSSIVTTRICFSRLELRLPQPLDPVISLWSMKESIILRTSSEGTESRFVSFATKMATFPSSSTGVLKDNAAFGLKSLHLRNDRKQHFEIPGFEAEISWQTHFKQRCLLRFWFNWFAFSKL